MYSVFSLTKIGEIAVNSDDGINDPSTSPNYLFVYCF